MTYGKNYTYLVCAPDKFLGRINGVGEGLLDEDMNTFEDELARNDEVFFSGDGHYGGVDHPGEDSAIGKNVDTCCADREAGIYFECCGANHAIEPRRHA